LDDPSVQLWGRHGEDTHFSIQARKLGYDLIVDTRLFCEHIKTTIVGKTDTFTR